MTNPNPLNAEALPKKGPGRPKGSCNKFTGDLRKAILAATDSYIDEETGKQGVVVWLESMRDDYPKAFMQMVARLIPLQVTGSEDAGSTPIKIVISAATADDKRD